MMSDTLSPKDRVRLRRYLIDTFSPADLKNLAFELGLDYPIFRYRTPIELSRELIAACESSGTLACLVLLALRRVPNLHMQGLLEDLPRCPARSMVQVDYYDDIISSEQDLREELSKILGTTPAELTLIGAARDHTRLLVGIPKAAVEQTLSSARDHIKELYRFTRLETYEELHPEDQRTWRYIVTTLPPESINPLRPVASWPQSRRAPSIAAQLSAAVGEALDPLWEILKEILERLLDRSLLGPRYRRWGSYLGFALLWAIFAGFEGVSPSAIPRYVVQILLFLRLDVLVDYATLVVGLPGSLRYSIFRILSTFFNLEVLRHLLWVYLAWWVAFRAASAYLVDLFELQDRSKASRHLYGALLGGAFHTLRIDGPQPNPRHPLIRIGGPGLVYTSLEWTALFETIENEPHVIRSGLSFINGYERLRQVISVKDQLSVKNNITEFSKDGVPVIADDVQILFSIDRAGQEPSFPEKVYPFQAGAIESIVYGQHITETEGQNWTERLSNTVSSEIRRFVSEHPLEEFLAEPPETDTFKLESTRRAVTKKFYDPNTEIQQRIRELSNSLIWINVGTWILPPDIETIPKEHIRAWRLSWLNRYRKRQAYQEAVRKSAQVDYIRKRIQELITIREDTSPAFINFDPLFLQLYWKQLTEIAADHVVGQSEPQHYKSLIVYLDKNRARRI